MLERKAVLLAASYEEVRIDPSRMSSSPIKWDADLARHRLKGVVKPFRPEAITRSLYRPFVTKWVNSNKEFNSRVFQTPAMFPPNADNCAIAVSIAKRANFAVVAHHSIPTTDLFLPDVARSVSRHRYVGGDRLDNITDWALKQFTDRYGKTAAISKDDIFAYVYAVLHDPVYRETYALNLKREFPRIPLYPDFQRWRDWGQALLDLHMGYETVAPSALTRTDAPDPKRAEGTTPVVKLKSDPGTGIIVLDADTQLSGVPLDAWRYRLGNRSAIDWVLDQHKEKTPKDPTIREKFNTYRFADYKEQVVDFLARVVTVSVRTVAITDEMQALKRT